MPNKFEINSNDLSVLPANLAEYLISPELTEDLVKIATKYDLSGKSNAVNLTGGNGYTEFVRLVTDTLKGDLPYESFEDLAKELLKIDDDTAKNLAKDADELFFIYFKNDLRGLYQEKQKVADMFLRTEKPNIKTETPRAPRKLKEDSYRETID